MESHPIAFLRGETKKWSSSSASRPTHTQSAITTTVKSSRPCPITGISGRSCNAKITPITSRAYGGLRRRVLGRLRPMIGKHHLSHSAQARRRDGCALQGRRPDPRPWIFPGQIFGPHPPGEHGHVRGNPFRVQRVQISQAFDSCRQAHPPAHSRRSRHSRSPCNLPEPEARKLAAPAPKTVPCLGTLPFVGPGGDG